MSEQTGLKRMPMEMDSKAQESSLGKVTMRATATSAQVVQELLVAQVPQNELKLSTTKSPELSEHRQDLEGGRGHE